MDISKEYAAKWADQAQRLSDDLIDMANDRKLAPIVLILVCMKILRSFKDQDPAMFKIAEGFIEKTFTVTISENRVSPKADA